VDRWKKVASNQGVQISWHLLGYAGVHKTMLVKIKFQGIDSWNLVGAHPRCMLLLNKGLVGSILVYASLSYSGMARTHFLKLEKLQYRSLRITLGLMQSTPNNSHWISEWHFSSAGKRYVPQL
jgi:hypothetical protein